jgi:two-component system, sensor histidine kinase and response regulator
VSLQPKTKEGVVSGDLKNTIPENEAWFRFIFENAQIGIGIFNIEKEQHSSNQALQEMLGYSGEELSRLDRWDDIVHPEERASNAKRYAELVQGKKDRDEYTQRFIRRDDEIVTASGRFTLIRDPAGKPRYVIALHEDISDRVRAEQALAASERLFRSIFENAQVGIGLFSLDGGKTFTNKALQGMLGYPAEELNLVEQWDQIVHPEQRISGAQRYADLVQGRRDKDEWEQQLIRRDGQIVTVNARFTLIRDAAGKPQYIAYLTEDVTERRRGEESRNRLTQQLQLILESTGQGIYGIDLKGRCTFINQATCQMIGYRPEDVLGRNMHDLVHHHKPDGSPYPAEDCPIYRAFRKGEGCRIDVEVMWRRDGTSLPVEYSSFPIVEGGRVTGAVVTVSDVTERKAAEALLNKREAELKHANFLAESALELTRAGYWHVPLDGSGWYNSSPRRVAVFGDIPRPDYRYRLDELFARAAEGDASAAAAAREAFTDAVEGRSSTYNTVFAYKRPIDGRIMWVHALGHVISDSSGKPTDIYGVSQDITEFKQLETELLRAKEVAEAATRAKSDFLANMSHEIRTPMNAIIGMTQLALRTELTAKQRDYLTKTKAAAETLLGIINDILDFSKIEAGKFSMEQVEFRLESVIDNVSTVVSQKAHEKNLEFLIDVQHDLPSILVGDPLRLGQVLINIVTNAVKFTQHGEVVITVRLKEQLSKRVKLTFEVRDSGIGMTPDQSARLFQPFSQADSSMTRKYGGTGLGLSISKRLVEMMEGNIWAESEYGRGTTFCFTGWFGVVSAENRAKKTPTIPADVRALVVDDNALAREIIADNLRRFVSTVDCVSSGEEAIRELGRADQDDPYELVLMDWHMPGLDGLESSRMIKQPGRLKNVPKIIIITAFGGEEIRLQAEEMGIEGFLQKPVTPSVLVETLMHIFGGAEEPHENLVTKMDIQSPDARGLRILLVEDNEVNQQVATELLQSSGARVTVAQNGREAVNILTHGEQLPPFDIVLMDLQMPEMDGLTATRLLRAAPGLQKLPIIAMTAHAMAEEIHQCLEAGMSDHVAKPIDRNAFFATITRWMPARERRISDFAAVAASEPASLEIEGIDVSGALQRVSGNVRLLSELLIQFASKQAVAAVEIATALDRGDRGLAEQRAHSLKGVAGNVGIEAIFHCAGKLEHAIRQSRSDVPDLLAKLSELLDRQVQTIQHALNVPITIHEDFPARNISDPSTLAAVTELRALLETNDAGAPMAYSTLAQTLKNTVDAAQLDALAACVMEFDFDGALLRLQEITKKHEATRNDESGREKGSAAGG